MLDRTKAPAYQRDTHFELLKPESVILDNGINLHFISGGKQDVIKLELLFKAGRWFEENPAAAHFTSTLLSKGSKNKNSFEIARIFDLYGAHLEINPGLDVVSVSLYSLVKNLAPVLDLLLEILTESTFPEKELEQSKVIFLQNLRVNKEKTSFQAAKLFRRNLFGESHPYGREVEEHEVDPVSQPQITSHFHQCYKDLFIVVSGRVNKHSYELISKTFSLLPTVSSLNKSHVVHHSNPSRVIQEKEGSVQASVRVGKRFIGRNHPDYFDVLLLNHILGGYFGSRLMKNIREEKGLTYGVYSSIHTLTHDNYFVIGADVNRENLDLTFDEIRKEMIRLRTEKIEVDELQTARNHFIGSLQGEITTPFSHADKLKNIIIYQLPSDYYSILIKRMDTLTAEDLLIAGEKYFNESSMFEIAVG